jgi:psiF repeat
MRIPTLLCMCGLTLFASEAIFAFDAAGQSATSGGPPAGGPPADATRSIGPLPAVGSEHADATRSIGPLPAGGQDPAERSAKSIECAQKADAQRLEGKPRKHFLHECRSGI